MPGPLAVAGLGSGCTTVLGILLQRPALVAAILIAPAALPAAVPGARTLAILPERGGRIDPAALAGALGPGGRVEVVAGADAVFRSGLTAAGRLALAFLRRP